MSFTYLPTWDFCDSRVQSIRNVRDALICQAVAVYNGTEPMNIYKLIALINGTGREYAGDCNEGEG